MGTTPGGLPYPEPTDDLNDGAAAIQALAEALDPMTLPWSGTVPFAKQGLDAYTTGDVVRIYRQGRVVTVTGAATATTDAARTAIVSGSASTANLIATLPAGLWPAETSLPFLCQGSSTSQWMLNIQPDGQLHAHRYSDTVPTKPWLNFAATFVLGPSTGVPVVTG